MSSVLSTGRFRNFRRGQFTSESREFRLCNFDCTTLQRIRSQNTLYRIHEREPQVHADMRLVAINRASFNLRSLWTWGNFLISDRTDKKNWRQFVNLLVKIGFANDHHVTLLGCLDVEERRFARNNRQDSHKFPGDSRVKVVLPCKRKNKVSRWDFEKVVNYRFVD